MIKAPGRCEVAASGNSLNGLWTIALSWLPAPLGIARDLFQHGLPCLLLRLDIRQEFGWRHRIGVVSGRFKLGPGCRIEDCLLSLSEIKSGCIDGANLRGVGWARYGQR